MCSTHATSPRARKSKIKGTASRKLMRSPQLGQPNEAALVLTCTTGAAPG
jgi:hypothetical protein